MIAQGAKDVFLGKERYRYDASKYLLVTAGLPLVSHVIQASKERPFSGARILLDPSVITEVLVDANHLITRPNRATRTLTVSRINASLLDARREAVPARRQRRATFRLAPLIDRDQRKAP